MKLSEFDKYRFRLTLLEVAEKVIPKISKQKAPTKVQKEKIWLLAEMTDKVVRGEYPSLKQLSTETGHPVFLQVRMIYHKKLRVAVNFRTEEIKIQIYSDYTSLGKKRPIDDGTPFMILLGTNYYVREDNAWYILNNKSRLEKITVLNSEKTIKCSLKATYGDIIAAKREGSNEILFFKLDCGKEPNSKWLYFDTESGTLLGRTDSGRTSYLTDRYEVLSRTPLQPDELPPEIKITLLTEII